MRDFLQHKYANGFSRPFFAADSGDGGSGGSGGDGDDPPAKTFTQEDVDKIVQDRLGREQKKYADYDELKKAKEKLDELEKSQMTEQEKLKAELDKAKKEAEDAAVKAAALELERTKEKICREAGLPEGFADRLKGATDEEIKADAESLKKLVPAKSEGGKGAPPVGGATDNKSGNTLYDAVAAHFQDKK